ncbi:MAG: glycosyltransferase family 2 protein [Saprospiraceae bacterium]|nr:glycosyltransferase family 2 protein [Saprospiraceae bacterium]
MMTSTEINITAPSSCSLIITTYNWPSALNLCLQSCLAQTRMPDEILIADDGSTNETRQVIEKFSAISAVPILHIWQDDLGFRLAAIRNKAFAAASGDYIIQIDGDLILHPRFVEDHLNLKRKGCFVSGSRALITEVHTKELLEGLSYTLLNHSKLLKRLNAIRFQTITRIFLFFKRQNNNHQYVLGANMAFWRKDLYNVNGYNTQFEGWGKEDNEIAIRLKKYGLKLMIIRNSCIVYHLHHKAASRSLTAANETMLKQALSSDNYYCQHGIKSRNPG